MLNSHSSVNNSHRDTLFTDLLKPCDILGGHQFQTFVHSLFKATERIDSNFQNFHL